MYQFSTRPIKRVAAVHDLSGVGRCALTVVIPVLSALGIQVCPVPTAVLSTQTDGFEGFTFCDLADYIKPIFSHWRANNIGVDCIYTGFLGSVQQIELLVDIINGTQGALIVVDPVMGDDGTLYPTITSEMSAKMRFLCAVADVVTPNLTECAALLDRPLEGTLTSDDLRKVLNSLCDMGPSVAVITGIPMSGDTLANCAFDRTHNRYYETRCKKLLQSYPGTGDTFTSVLTGLLLQDYPLEKAMQLATDYLSATIALTSEMGSQVREGIALERTLPLLIQYAQGQWEAAQAENAT